MCEMSSWQSSTEQTELSCLFLDSRRRKKVKGESRGKEPSCCCRKPTLPLLKDRDKLPSFPMVDPERKVEPTTSIILSVKRQREKTNGWNSANNCPTTLLKYFRPSVSFFFTTNFPILSCCSCHFYSRCSNNSSTWGLLDGMKSWKRFFRQGSSFVIPILLFVILSEIIHISNASPISSIPPTPTQTQINDPSASIQPLTENLRRYDVESGFLDFVSNDSDSRNSAGEDEYSGEEKKQSRLQTSVEFSIGNFTNTVSHYRGHKDNLYNNSRRVDDRTQLKFTFSNGQLPSSNDVEKAVATHLRQRQAHEAVMMMPLAMRMKTQPMPVTQEQNQLQGTLTLSGAISEDELGKCWAVGVNEIEKSTVPPLLVDFSFEVHEDKLIALFCNGTSYLAQSLQRISDKIVPQVISIDVKDSSISKLNLSLFLQFPRLESLSVTHSNVTEIIGSCPEGLKTLNISFNAVKKLNSSVFPGGEVDAFDYDDEQDAKDNFDQVAEIVGDGNSSTMADNTTTNFSLNKVLSISPIIQFVNKTPSDPKIAIPSRFSPAHYLQKSVQSTTHKNFTSSENIESSFEKRKRDSSQNNSSNDKVEVSKRNRNGGVGLIQAAKNNNDNNDNSKAKHDNSKRETKAGLGSFPPELTLHTITCQGKEMGKCKFDSEQIADGQTGEKLDHSLQRRNSDLDKSASYSYEDEELGSDNGDYYQQGGFSSASTFTTASSRTTSGSSSSTGNNDVNYTKESLSEEAMTTMSSSNIRRISFTGSLEDIDLSHNKISEIPRAVLHLKSLKSLRLSGNVLKFDFVWEKLADWYMKSDDPNILKDGDDTFCLVDDVRHFQYPILGILKAKKDVVETCKTVDKSVCPECGLYSLPKQPGHGYNFSHQSPHGNVAIALKLDCSNRNLLEMPRVPPQTWQLNVSGNFIKDLSPLKEPMYENLLILDADTNEISALDGLVGTSFQDRYNYLSLRNNRFAEIPGNILSSLKNMRGQGVTLLGANFIECDCDSVKEIKPLLLENSRKIKDSKEIYCKNMKMPSSESLMAIEDLQFTDLCYMDSEESNEMYLYLIIGIELLLIVVIVAKVWHDQRTFRRTGILPWCSAKMPRLPCDAMLESVKEPPHFNRSSSTNVRSFTCEPPTQSISSHVQLREVRSNSGQSEKSSQISQLSSFPSSSRTSSV